MHATNNHSDIILTLKFLLMMLLSDALRVSSRANIHMAVRPESAAGGQGLLSSPLTVQSSALHQRLAVIWSGQHLIHV